MVLINQSGVLKKATVSQITGTQPITGYVKADGTVAMTGNLTIGATPSTGTHAATVAWVQGYVSAGSLGYTPINKAGDSGIGNLTMSGSLTLAGDPASALVAAPKQYVDAAVSPLATQTSLTSHTSRTDNPHATTKAQVGLGSVDNTSDLSKPVSTATQTALNGKLDLSGGTLTGALALPAAAPTVGTQATNKTYVDGLVSAKLNNSGTNTYTGDLAISTGWLTLNGTSPLSANSAATKYYVDSLTIRKPRIVASAYFQTAIVPANTVDQITFRSVLAYRTASSTTVTINYSSLGASYNNASMPFFVEGQYIGLNTGVTGITGKLYRINSVDYNATTFTITTTETTALNGVAVQLSIVYNNRTGSDVESYNVKSIYINMTAPSKYYVNYANDIISGSATTISSLGIANVQASGVANLYANNKVDAIVLQDVGRTTNYDAVNIPEGFGASSMGCHIGFFYSSADGADYSGLWAASFAITSNRIAY